MGKKTIAFTLLFIASLGGLIYYLHHEVDALGSGADAAIQQMRRHPELWNTEKYYPALMADFKANNIATIGITPSAVFVTTRTGARYFVMDYAGKISGSILSEYEKTAPKHLQLAVLRSEEIHFDPSEIVFYLGLAGFVLYFICEALTKIFDSRKKKDSYITFEDVIGSAEAKQAFSDVVDYLRNPEKYEEFGAKPPKGILLVGPPGVGKTQLARAIAGECNASFEVITGSDFSSKFYGAGIMRVKSVFRKARRKAPCILFIDEIDGVGKRIEVDRASDAETNRIINQLMIEMDGFNTASGVIVIGATNNPQNLDEAMVREGRFDRKIYVNLPGLDDRKSLFEHYTGKVRSSESLDFGQLARVTTGLTPAAIASVVNTAAFLAARKGNSTVDMTHLVEAIETVSIGEITSAGKRLTSEERRRIAVHEAGHAIVTKILNSGVLEKVTILPRGPALGVTMVTSNKETELYLRSELENRIQMLLGGRVAEKLVFRDFSSGAASDLKEASVIAFQMVAEFGMGKDGKLFSLSASQKLGLHIDHQFYLDQSQVLLNDMEERCVQVLTENRPALNALVEMLLERETVPGGDVDALVCLPKSAVA